MRTTRSSHQKTITLTAPAFSCIRDVSSLVNIGEMISAYGTAAKGATVDCVTDRLYSNHADVD
jgi:hypothetical protein